MHPSKEGCSAGRTHGAIAKEALKGESLFHQTFVCREVIERPIIWPMAWVAFLIGDNEDNVGAFALCAECLTLGIDWSVLLAGLGQCQRSADESHPSE